MCHSMKTLITNNDAHHSKGTAVNDDLKLEMSGRKSSTSSTCVPSKLIVDSWAKSLLGQVASTEDQDLLKARSFNMLDMLDTDELSRLSVIDCVPRDSESEACDAGSIMVYEHDCPVNIASKSNFVTHEKSEKGTVASCWLRSEMEINGGSWKSGNQATKSSCAGSRRGSLPSTLAECRGRYNFLTGLEMERERLREARQP